MKIIRTTSENPNFQKLIKLLESNLGYNDFETVEPRTFNQLGGDSLGAALFSMSIEEIFDITSQLLICEV